MLTVRFVYEYGNREVYGEWYSVMELVNVDLPLRAHDDYKVIRVEFQERNGN